jgi:hypothetical protein
MKFVTTWTFRAGGSAKENEDSARRLLELYSKWQPPAGLTFHQMVGRLDSGGGFAVSETDNPADIVDATSKFAPYADYQIYPVADIAETVQAAHEAVNFRESIS